MPWVPIVVEHFWAQHGNQFGQPFVSAISVKVGDDVALGQEILILENDKVSFGVHSPAQGRLVRLWVKVGEKFRLDEAAGYVEMDTGESC